MAPRSLESKAKLLPLVARAQVNLIPRFLSSEDSIDQAIKASTFNGSDPRMVTWSHGTEVPSAGEAKGEHEAVFHGTKALQPPCRQVRAWTKLLNPGCRPGTQLTYEPVPPRHRRYLDRMSPLELAPPILEYSMGPWNQVTKFPLRPENCSWIERPSDSRLGARWMFKGWRWRGYRAGRPCRKRLRSRYQVRASYQAGIGSSRAGSWAHRAP